MNRTTYDVVIVGAGPNALTAGVLLSRCGLATLILERSDAIGGSCRTDCGTLPGYHHDVCAAIHPTGAMSPVFRRLPLERHGLRWLNAGVALAHPFDDGRAAVLSRDLRETMQMLGEDAGAWHDLIGPFVHRSADFFSDVLRPIRVPRRPLLMARFGLVALRSALSVASRFRTTQARALFAGNAAHSVLPLDAPGSASFGLVLAAAAHAVDWPFAEGGSQRIVDALAALARAHGCDIQTGVTVRSLAELPPAKAVLFDLTPRQVEAIAGSALPSRLRRQFRRYRYGAGSFKVDYALSAPIPWKAAACATAATVHVGGTIDEIARSEADANRGRVCERPFVLVAQQAEFDPTRAPEGHSTGWAYCHVPNGSHTDMSERIEKQIERFAPGFRDTILARRVLPPSALEAHNPNLVGGDIGGGANTLRQFLFRPVPRWDPYSTGNPRLYLCSSSTPPGGGVHGMCGYWAARSVLSRVFGRSLPEDLRV